MTMPRGDESMENYLHIGGGKDGLSFPAADDAETAQCPVGITDKETYTRLTLSLGDMSIVVYVHESLTVEQALDRLVAHYKAWAVKRTGGRRLFWRKEKSQK
jgi:hypothetical protein